MLEYCKFSPTLNITIYTILKKGLHIPLQTAVYDHRITCLHMHFTNKVLIGQAKCSWVLVAYVSGFTFGNRRAWLCQLSDHEKPIMFAKLSKYCVIVLTVYINGSTKVLWCLTWPYDHIVEKCSICLSNVHFDSFKNHHRKLSSQNLKVPFKLSSFIMFMK